MAMEVEQKQTRDLGLPLFAVEIIVLIVSLFWVLSRRMSIPHCGTQCDFVGLDAAGNLFLVVCAVVLVMSIGAFVIQRRRSQPDWWAPTFGTALIIVGALIANYWSDVALRFIT